MKIPYVLTPGPTQVRENVRLERAKETTNPDIDIQFYDFYKETCEKVAKIMNTKNEVRILSGEGILGLESACASLTEPGDRVLVIDNGIFGEGFGDFVKLYGGEVVFFKGDRQKNIDVSELKKFLEKDSDFKYATVVHCDTPSGVLNDIEKICPLLKSKGIITIVDTVAAMGGEELKVDEWNIDIALGASQKAISAPPGLTIVSISKDAFNVMENRNKQIASFYCNLLVWKDYYKNKWFPYTMPISDIIGFRKAIDNILEEGIENTIKRHKNIADATRKALVEVGFTTYIKSGFSSTVTVINVPKEINSEELLKLLREKYNLLITGSFGYLKGKVIRIGHMGENAKKEKILFVLNVFEKALISLGFKMNNSMVDIFLSYIG
ncbi:pyridoxal-phosphate-dependent aminotransferase family protein [Clostridium botulinum]|uniref:pyridoxal-phosphate-dependent aminotransferase family protein n=1 Tax=Clostridium botulinum TaxID=1491 RepID=UPI0002D4047E|nr:alanine--glyoxylate aminotransferase family protein [Clostridium botulinum]KLU76870.1 serine-pyruvate aminotransferase/archaeal aspartate aminotransferase [Clostridium botulinum V891]KOA72729.1 serine-pyruvate aminotransferase/archaeal aspartate aminotransferase [Clostridium botulinum]KOA92163.1 serine-pyruvate aminotransferase/archaeal aspartate aminotransferase [Clostridium botulinum]KOC30994.1 serine-pyruvate aminotransferase/archaeal aspartate aminotransferase [Clostridium botulinum]MCD